LKYTAYILFVLFIVVSILFLKSALKPEETPLIITGSEKCGTCHSLKNIGNQQKIWEDSKHSRAFNSLTSEKAKQFAQSKGLESPEKNPICLKCHTTKHYLDINETDAAYSLNEGVGCEACHGAGSRYSPANIMKEESLFIQNGGLKGNTETCIKCHSPVVKKTDEKISSDICPFQLNDFDYKTYSDKIKHNISRDLMQ